MSGSLTITTIVSGAIIAGAAIADWGVSDTTKDKIRLSLEKRLYRFRYTTLRTFGHDEIDFSVRAIARLLGPRLFSWHRLAVVTGLYIAVLMALLSRSGQWNLLNIFALPLAMMGAAFFALGISLTIETARWVTKAWVGRTVLATVVIIAFHIVLFLYWRPVLGLADSLLTDWIVAALRYFYLHFYGISIPGPVQGGAWIHWQNLLFALEPTRAAEKAIIEYRLLASGQLGFTTGLVGNCLALLLFALRIGLLGYFLGGVAYVKWIRPALIWFWTGVLRSHAVLTPPASAIAALIYAGSHGGEIAMTMAALFR